MAATLENVEQLVDELTPADQARLLAYLAPRVPATNPTSTGDDPPPSPAGTAWAEFLEAGRQVAAHWPAGVSAAEAVSDGRR